MEHDAAIPPASEAVLASIGFGRVIAVEVLAGGNHGRALRLRADADRSVVMKTGSFKHADVYRTEAAGLQALRVPGGPRTPDVYGCGDDFILMEDMPAPVPDDGPFWETFGRQLAALHSVSGPAFGYHTDNFLGALPQTNAWTDDGWTFFAEQRVLRYLDEPKCLAALDGEDRAGIERLCTRLPALVPAQAPSLLHGDIWRMNIVCAADGTPVIIDPAPYHAWAEIDLSMLAVIGRLSPLCVIPQRFFDAYAEVHPPAPGMVERFELLIIREVLSGIAHNDPSGFCVKWIREIIKRFA